MNDLPLPPLVAFAARCALRVEAFLRHHDSGPPDDEWAAAIARATGVAARFARGERPRRDEMDEAIAAARRAADRAEFPPWRLAALFAAEAAREACAAPSASADTLFGLAMAQECASEVAARAQAACEAAGAVGDVREALSCDLETLRELAHGPPPDLGPPIDPCGGGPLGPLGPDERGPRRG